MHKYIILALSLCAPLHCMEQQIAVREPREWDAHAYDKGNQLQTNAFLYFLDTNDIDITNKTILDVGCGTGKITAQLAERATYIHGFDASKNMIAFAQDNHGHINNISFEYCFAENFTSVKQYQLALASFSVPWIEDKKQAFQNINNSLTENGEFFGVIKTTDNPKPIHFAILNEMMPLIKQYVSPDAQEISSTLGSSYLSQQEYTRMLCETGFEIIQNKEQSFDCIMNEAELRKFQWSLFLARPIIQSIPKEEQQLLFEEFMKRYLEKLPKIDNDQFLNKVIINIVHARKVKK